MRTINIVQFHFSSLQQAYALKRLYSLLGDKKPRFEKTVACIYIPWLSNGSFMYLIELIQDCSSGMEHKICMQQIPGSIPVISW